MVFLPWSCNIGDLLQGKHPEILCGIGVAVFSRKFAISLKQGKIGPRLLLMTNRKSHTGFQLVPKSTEWPLLTVVHNSVFSELITKIWIKINPYYQQRRCSPVTLVSGDIRFMRILPGFSKWLRKFPSEFILVINTSRVSYLAQFLRYGDLLAEKLQILPTPLSFNALSRGEHFRISGWTFYRQD